MPAKKITAVFVMLLSAFGMSKMSSCKNFPRDNIVRTATEPGFTSFTIGRYLFYDRRLSVNKTRSCGTCHNPAFAFTDGYKRSLGAFADLHQRNTEALFNLSELRYLTAADSTLHTPLQQMSNPLLNDHPAEMGVKGNEDVILQRVKADAQYRKLFASSGMEISWANIRNAISVFILNLRSKDALYDRFMKGDSSALNENEKRGMQLFFSPALKCSSCHGGTDFSTPVITGPHHDTIFYFNTGLYNTNERGAYPPDDQGLYMLTKNKADIGKFRVPSLRNLGFTAPYFHDGSAASLKDVIDIYAAGGRYIKAGADKGNGIINPYKHPFITGFSISQADRINLIKFLMSLNDSSFIQNPAYQNPFTSDETEKKY